VRVAFPIIAIGVVGCSALTSLDDLSGGDAANFDGSGSDVSNSDVVQANDADDAGGGNLVANGGFENGQGGCGTNWGNGYSMTFSRVSPGHTGNSACLVCTNLNNPSSYQLNAVTPVSVPAGNYYAEAWIESPWDGGVATPTVGIQVEYVGDGGVTGCNGDNFTCQGSFVSAGGWGLSTATFVVTAPGTLQVVVHSYSGTPNSCFALDDVALYAQ